MPQGWEEWGAAVTIVGTFFTVAVLLLLIYQIYLQRRERKREAVALLYSYIDTPEFRRAAHFIYTNKPEDLTIGKLAKEELEHVEFVANAFDRVGFLTRTGQMYEDDVYYLYRGPILKTAQQLQIHLKDQRNRRAGAGAKRYDPDFDWLAKRFKMRQLGENGIKIDRSIRKLPLNELLKIKEIQIDRFRLMKKEILERELKKIASISKDIDQIKWY